MTEYLLRFRDTLEFVVYVESGILASDPCIILRPGPESELT